MDESNQKQDLLIFMLLSAACLQDCGALPGHPLFHEGVIIMRDIENIRFAGRIIRKMVRPVLLCSAVVIGFPAIAQESPGPALKGKAHAFGNQGSGTSQQLQEDAARNRAQRLELKERIKRENAKRGIVPLAERMKPAGSHPAPSPGNPNPLNR